MLEVFFTIVYFRIFLFLIDLRFRHTTIDIIINIRIVICWIIAFIISVGLAEYTVEKIKDKYGKK